MEMRAASNPGLDGRVPACAHERKDGEVSVWPTAAVPALHTDGNEGEAELCWRYGDGYWEDTERSWWMGLGGPCCAEDHKLERRWRAPRPTWCDGCGRRWKQDGCPFWRCDGGCDYDVCETCAPREGAFNAGRRRVPRDGNCLYWAVMASQNAYDAAHLGGAAARQDTVVCGARRSGETCACARSSLCWRMGQMREGVAEAEISMGGSAAQRREGTPAETVHLGLLADVLGKRIVVQSTGGRGWQYEAGWGDGGSVYVMWDGEAHFDGVAAEAVARHARGAVAGR